MFDRTRTALKYRMFRRDLRRRTQRREATERARVGMYTSLENDRAQALEYASEWHRLAEGEEQTRATMWRDRLASHRRVGLKTFPILALRARKDDPPIEHIAVIEEIGRSVLDEGQDDDDLK